MLRLLLNARAAALFQQGPCVIDGLLVHASPPVASTSSASTWVSAWSSQLLAQSHQQQRMNMSGSASASSSPSAPSTPASDAALAVPPWYTAGYQQLMQDYNAMEAALRKASQLDGTKRLQFSTNVLRFPIPPHDIEPDLPSMDVYLRPDYGSNFCKWLRKTKRVPGRVMFKPAPGPDGLETPVSLLIHFAKGDVDRLVRKSGREGCQASIVQLRVLDPDNPERELTRIRAKPQRVLCHAASLEVENLELIHCRQQDLVKVNVPIRPINLDASVGVRKGGWIMMLKRTVKYQCLGSHVPPFIEVDVRSLDLEGTVRVRDLAIPEGTRLTKQDYDQLVLRCTTEGGDEVAVK